MSSIKLLVLGAFARRSHAHGYRIYRDLIDWRVETWTRVKPGSIYHALSQLETQGMIKPQESTEAKLGPARTEYNLTANGQAEFIALLESALKSIDFIELSAGIAFMEMLPRKRVITLLQKRITALKETSTFLKNLPTEASPSEPSKHPELINVWVDHFEYAVMSTEKLVSLLQAGKYVFKDEKGK
jgi:DNA-binding PadR family transcriptional regulator